MEKITGFYTTKYLRIFKKPWKQPFISFGRHKGNTKSLTAENYANEASARRAAKSMTEIMILHLKELGYNVTLSDVLVSHDY